mmetsp:Transcript_23960/g.32619  ORF Transcript_23960/g.32619 Transcript_23960/m.32619 type:complete len:310 (+) Transcript_23960:2-931(+)
MAEYGDDEIGELDQDDPDLQGTEQLEAFDHVLESFLDLKHRGELRTLGAHPYARGQLDSFRSGWGDRIGMAYGRGGQSSKTASPAVDDGAAASNGAWRGDGENEESASSSDEDEEAKIEQHPFLAGLREPRREDNWDAETILSTYSTTDNHPTTIRVRHKPKREQVYLDRTTGLPSGFIIPGSKAAAAANAADPPTGLAAATLNSAYGTARGASGRVDVIPEDADEEETDDADGARSGANLGAARRRGEAADEKRARKAAAKAGKAARRVEKKETKLAFKSEKFRQLETYARTAQIAATPLSGESMIHR